MVIVGIDPGKQGGIAVIVDDKYAVFPMPELFRDTVQILEGYRNGICILEKVHASPQMGVSSAFNFGYHFGCLETICAGIFKQFYCIIPQNWQAALNCRTRGDKKVSRDMAERLFPDAKVTLKTADALLLAYYGKMKYGK